MEAQAAIESEATETQTTEAPRYRGSVVHAAYKARYTARGDATNCGDWLAATLKPLVPYVVVDGRLRVDVVALDSFFAENGVDSTVGKWGQGLHNEVHQTPGWEGRFAMSGRNILRRKVEAAGKLVWGGNHYFPQTEVEPEQEC